MFKPYQRHIYLMESAKERIVFLKHGAVWQGYHENEDRRLAESVLMVNNLTRLSLHPDE